MLKIYRIEERKGIKHSINNIIKLLLITKLNINTNIILKIKKKVNNNKENLKRALHL